MRFDVFSVVIWTKDLFNHFYTLSYDVCIQGDLKKEYFSIFAYLMLTIFTCSLQSSASLLLWIFISGGTKHKQKLIWNFLLLILGNLKKRKKKKQWLQNLYPQQDTPTARIKKCILKFRCLWILLKNEYLKVSLIKWTWTMNKTRFPGFVTFLSSGFVVWF